MLQTLEPAVTNNLTTRDTIKQELKISGTDSDNDIDRWIEEASSKISAYCRVGTFGRRKVRQTEYCAGSSIILELNLEPTITSVTVGGSALNDYVLNEGMLYRLSSDAPVPWSNYGGTVVIEYTTGYVLLGNLPQAIERACIDLVKQLYFDGPRDSRVKSERVLDIMEQSFHAQSSSAADSELPPGIAASLQPFVVEVIV